MHSLVNVFASRFPKELKSQKHKLPGKLKWYFASLLSLSLKQLQDLPIHREHCWFEITVCLFTSLMNVLKQEMQMLHRERSSLSYHLLIYTRMQLGEVPACRKARQERLLAPRSAAQPRESHSAPPSTAVQVRKSHSSQTEHSNKVI